MKHILAIVLISAGTCWAQTNATLDKQLQDLTQSFKEKMEPETLRVFDQGVEAIRIAGIADHTLKVGDKAETFSLPNANGEIIALDTLLAKGPVVLIWYRGVWCPYCNTQLIAMQNALPEIQSLGATLVAISPQLPDSTLSTTEKDALTFEVLSDVDNKTARHYGLVYSMPPAVAEELKKHVDLAAINGNNRNELPLAATYVIDQTGTIRYAFIDPDYRKRAEPAEIIQSLKDIK